MSGSRALMGRGVTFYVAPQKEFKVEKIGLETKADLRPKMSAPWLQSVAPEPCTQCLQKTAIKGGFDNKAKVS